MKNLAILLLIIAAVVFGGKLVIEKGYESKLDEAIQNARGFADLRYDNVKVDFDGSISLNGLSIIPAGFDQSLDIGQIRAISSDRLLALNRFAVFDDGNFPETFELSLNQVSVPVAGFEDLAQKFGSQFDGEKVKECRSVNTSFNYSDAGYSRIDGDIRMAFDFSDVYNAIINIDMFDQTSSLQLEWLIDASQVKSVAEGRSKQLPITEVSLDLELEPDAAERFVKHCADEFKVTPEVFLNKVVGSSKYSENSFGTDLGPEMRTALIKFMRGGSSFSLYSKPSLQMKKLDQLQFYKAKDVLRWMNLSLSLDGEELPILDSVLAAEAEAQEKAKLEKQKAIAKPKYTVISASSAANYIGRWVRVSRTDSRKSLEGKLSGIGDQGRLLVDLYQHGGLMTLNVRRSEIKRLEVLNKKGDQ